MKKRISKYWVLDEPKEWGDAFYSIHDTLEKANKQARMDWSYKTGMEKEKRRIYVVEAPETGNGCLDYNRIHTTAEMFDSEEVTPA